LSPIAWRTAGQFERFIRKVLDTIPAEARSVIVEGLTRRDPATRPSRRAGKAADALRTDTHADLMTTCGGVDQLQATASVTRSGASELDAARSQLRYAVEDARSAGCKSEGAGSRS
jgi:hypothetical protein